MNENTGGNKLPPLPPAADAHVYNVLQIVGTMTTQNYSVQFLFE